MRGTPGSAAGRGREQQNDALSRRFTNSKSTEISPTATEKIAKFVASRFRQKKKVANAIYKKSQSWQRKMRKTDKRHWFKRLYVEVRARFKDIQKNKREVGNASGPAAFDCLKGCQGLPGKPISCQCWNDAKTKQVLEFTWLKRTFSIIPVRKSKQGCLCAAAKLWENVWCYLTG